MLLLLSAGGGKGERKGKERDEKDGADAQCTAWLCLVFFLLYGEVLYISEYVSTVSSHSGRLGGFHMNM